METTEKKQYELQAWANAWHPEQLTPERVSASRMVDDEVLETLKDVLEEHFIDDESIDWNCMLNSAISMVEFPERIELEEELKQKAKNIFAEKGLEFNGDLRIEWDIVDWDPFGFCDDDE